MAKIQLAFHNSSLTGDEEEKAELTGMLILASDFIKSGKVKGAESLERISKALFPIYLNQTKSGNYIAVNPFSTEPTDLQLMQLPSIAELQEYVNEKKNLTLNRLYGKLMDLESTKTTLEGAYNDKNIDMIIDLLAAPRDNRTDFTVIPPLRDVATVKTELAEVNERIYDDASLNKAIKERIVIIEKALQNDVTEKENKLEERTDFWKLEIKNKNENLEKELVSRNKQFDQEISDLEGRAKSKSEENFEKFILGVSKNIRKDEQPLEATIMALEKLTSRSAKPDDVPKIERLLQQLADQTDTFKAAVLFAQRQVKSMSSKEFDIKEMHKLDIDGSKVRSEREKQEFKEKANLVERDRDRELVELKAEREESAGNLARFKDLKSQWIQEVAQSIETKGKRMIPESSLNISSPAKFVELMVPIYLFQYKHKKGEIYTVVVPPLQLPDNFKKPGKAEFYGDAKTVGYNLVVSKTKKLIANWFENAALQRDIQANIVALPNLLDDPAGLRDTFFTSQSLMIDKLKANKKDVKKANDRLTDVWTSG